MAKIIGIDLGTTNSCVAVLEGGQATVLPNTEGARTTPSIVAFSESGDRLVGQQAKRQAVVNPTRTAFGIKRLLGRRFQSSEIQSYAERLPFELAESLNGDVWVEINGANYSPQELSAAILAKLKTTAEDYFGEEISEAVITVPAYFDDAQRQATKEAGHIAGLDVRRIINEPTAAALAYGLKQQERANLAIVDLGGGTFDVSIVRVQNEVFEVLSTAGDNTLGGDDFDRRVLDYLLDLFEEESGLQLENDPVAIQRLQEAAETAKRELSTLTETNINLPFLAMDARGPQHLNTVLTRAKLVELCMPLIEALEGPCKQALADSGLKLNKIHEVLLVGGMTRMPAVQERIEGIFNKAPRKGVNPDEVVACGAAIQSGILGGDLREVILMDVTPLSLGIRTAGDRMSIVIPRNTAIPTRQTKVFTTTEDNQDLVTIAVVQGEDAKASNNRLLGRFHLSDLPLRPAGQVRIEVCFDIDTDGIVHVTAKDTGTGLSTDIVITDHGGLSEEERHRAVSRINGPARAS